TTRTPGTCSGRVRLPTLTGAPTPRMRATVTTCAGPIRPPPTNQRRRPGWRGATSGAAAPCQEQRRAHKECTTMESILIIALAASVALHLYQTRRAAVLGHDASWQVHSQGRWHWRRPRLA